MSEEINGDGRKKTMNREVNEEQISMESEGKD